MRMILTACKQGVAAVVVTHDAQLASWADRVVFLRDGRVVDQTVPPPSPEALLEESSQLRASALVALAGVRVEVRRLTICCYRV